MDALEVVEVMQEDAHNIVLYMILHRTRIIAMFGKEFYDSTYGSLNKLIDDMDVGLLKETKIRDGKSL